MERCTKEITKEQYDKVKDDGRYILDKNKPIIFDDGEIYGYGVYCAHPYQQGDKYYVDYGRGSTCD